VQFAIAEHLSTEYQYTDIPVSTQKTEAVRLLTLTYVTMYINRTDENGEKAKNIYIMETSGSISFSEMISAQQL